MPFIDVCWQADGVPKKNVFRNPTETNKHAYVQFDSHQGVSTKRLTVWAVTTGLANRAAQVSQEP